MNKKVFLGVMVAILIIPQITFAAWWNPLSWFNNWSFSKSTQDAQVQVLENRIKELERKIGSGPSETDETANQIVPPEKQAKGDNMPVVPPQPPKKSVVAPKPVPSPMVVQPIAPISVPPPLSVQPTRDYKVLYDDLQAKYVFMRDRTVDSQIARVKMGSIQDASTWDYLKYLNDLYSKLDNLLGKVGKRIPTEFDLWKTTYDQIVYEYNNRSRNYDVFLNETASLLATQEANNKKEEEQALLEAAQRKADYVKEIKIELVELKQLSNKISLGN